MQQCSDNVPPVVRVIVVDGNEIEIRYHGTWGDLCRNYVRSLPQNGAMEQRQNDVPVDRDLVIGGPVDTGERAAVGHVRSGG